ncbi:MAG: hypothetical protein WB770_11745 [Acidimicrobiales bacterium]
MALAEADAHYPVPVRSRKDEVVRRLLAIPEGAPVLSATQAQRSFSVAMVLSGLRCLFSYVIVPVVLPLLGLAVGAAPYIGVPVALLALVFDVRGIRRYWLANSSHRWAMTWIYLAVIVLVLFLLVHDLLAI